MMKLSFVVIFLAIGQSVYGQLVVVGGGECPNVKSMTEFDLAAYTGVWYEQEKYPVIFELGQKCETAKYLARENDTSTIDIINSSILSLFNRPVDIKGYAKVLGPGQLAVVFGFINEKNLRNNYNVLDTDYKSYALVYSCTQVWFARNEFAWILTRERNPSEEVIAKARQVMVDNGISMEYLRKTNQVDCPTQN